MNFFLLSLIMTISVDAASSPQLPTEMVGLCLAETSSHAPMGAEHIQ